MPYLERLHDELDIPILYVSHAPEEVARLADHLVLMENGRAVACGPTPEMMARADLASSFADDLSTVLTVVIGAHESDDITHLEFAGGSLFVGRLPDQVGKKLRCRIHARDVSLSLSHHSDMSILNVIPATVTKLTAAAEPGHILVEMALADGSRLTSRVTGRSIQRLNVREKTPVFAQIRAVSIFR